VTAMHIIEELFGLSDISVLVTGGSRGIGSAIAEAFVRAGARVYICSRDAGNCTMIAAELAEFGKCVALPCDLASQGDRKRLVEQLAKYEPSLNVLVNNAGTIWTAPLEEYPESGWDKVFNLNVRGVFFLIKELVPLLSAAASVNNPSRIINVGSIDAFRIAPHESYAYAASKAALHHLTRMLAKRLAVRHITVNVIAPGLYPSKMLAAPSEREAFEALVAPIPLKRLACPSDMAGAAIYLASKAGSYTTGAVLPVDGGLATTL